MYFKFGDNDPYFFDEEVWKKLDSTAFPLDLVAESSFDDPWIFPKYITNSLGDEIELSYDVLDSITRTTSEMSATRSSTTSATTTSATTTSSLDYVTLNHILFFRFNLLKKYLRNELIKKF